NHAELERSLRRQGFKIVNVVRASSALSSQEALNNLFSDKNLQPKGKASSALELTKEQWLTQFREADTEVKKIEVLNRLQEAAAKNNQPAIVAIVEIIPILKAIITGQASESIKEAVIMVLKVAASQGSKPFITAIGEIASTLKEIVIRKGPEDIKRAAIRALDIAAVKDNQPAIAVIGEIAHTLKEIITGQSSEEIKQLSTWALLQAVFRGNQSAINILEEIINGQVSESIKQIAIQGLRASAFLNNHPAITIIGEVVLTLKEIVNGQASESIKEATIVALETAASKDNQPVINVIAEIVPALKQIIASQASETSKQAARSAIKIMLTKSADFLSKEAAKQESDWSIILAGVDRNLLIQQQYLDSYVAVALNNDTDQQNLLAVQLKNQIYHADAKTRGVQLQEAPFDGITRSNLNQYLSRYAEAWQEFKDFMDAHYTEFHQHPHDFIQDPAGEILRSVKKEGSVLSPLLSDVPVLSETITKENLPAVGAIGRELEAKGILEKTDNGYVQKVDNCLEIAQYIAKRFGYRAPANEFQVALTAQYGGGTFRSSQPSPVNLIVRNEGGRVRIDDGDYLHVSIEAYGREYNFGAKNLEEYKIIRRIPLHRLDDPALIDKITETVPATNPQNVKAPGGIDLNPNLLQLEIRNNSGLGRPVIVPFDLKNFQGFTFRIIKINRIADFAAIFDFPQRVDNVPLAEPLFLPERQVAILKRN
ncbi:MAG: hypothetical protein WCI77_06505, partial [Candidatus Omnitrophota bacterium]